MSLSIMNVLQLKTYDGLPQTTVGVRAQETAC
jgi:hypothetical protein